MLVVAEVTNVVDLTEEVVVVVDLEVDVVAVASVEEIVGINVFVVNTEV